MPGRLSVVMPVHNALPYLEEAIESIVAQSFADFEFVILDDGSTDGSGAVLDAWAAREPRIRLVRSERRLGPAGSSNRVVAEARTPLVARMDADDIAHPERLERQIRLFEAEPDAVLIGTLWDVIDERGRRVRAADRSRLLRESPFAPFSHPTIMFRREAFDRVGGYRKEADRWEDVDLYLRFAEAGRILVLAEPLVSVRHSHVSTRLRDGRDAFEKAMHLMYCCLADYVRGKDYTPILMGPHGPEEGEKLVLPSFITCGSPLVWAGQRPHAFSGVTRRGLLRWNRGSATALAWAAWADLSPRTLRAFLQAYLKIRNRAARRALGSARWVEWKPPHA
jgi:glycosyltransferase involved in cell wall biosynthesis